MSDSDFNTPPWIIGLVKQLDRGYIGLDPCSNATSMVGAGHRYTKDNGLDGLQQTWRGLGTVFMNPPHSQSPNNIEPWIEKFLEEFPPYEPSHKLWKDQFVGLVPAKTGPRWFHEAVESCTSVCFLKGRIKFWQNGVEMPGPGKFDSLVLYRGIWDEKFKNLFKPYGWVV